MAGEIEEPFSFSFQADSIHSGSISFGRFESEPLSWERRSSFSHNRYLEEVEKCSKPGSVIEKKAYFEAHFKKKGGFLRQSSSDFVSSSVYRNRENDTSENVDSKEMECTSEDGDSAHFDESPQGSVHHGDYDVAERDGNKPEVTDSQMDFAFSVTNAMMDGSLKGSSCEVTDKHQKGFGKTPSATDEEVEMEKQQEFNIGKEAKTDKSGLAEQEDPFSELVSGKGTKASKPKVKSQSSVGQSRRTISGNIIKTPARTSSRREGKILQGQKTEKHSSQAATHTDVRISKAEVLLHVNLQDSKAPNAKLAGENRSGEKDSTGRVKESCSSVQHGSRASPKTSRHAPSIHSAKPDAKANLSAFRHRSVQPVEGRSQPRVKSEEKMQVKDNGKSQMPARKQTLTSGAGVTKTGVMSRRQRSGEVPSNPPADHGQATIDASGKINRTTAEPAVASVVSPPSSGKNSLPEVRPKTDITRKIDPAKGRDPHGHNKYRPSEVTKGQRVQGKQKVAGHGSSNSNLMANRREVKRVGARSSATGRLAVGVAS